jgi:hypothetical protein
VLSAILASFGARIQQPEKIAALAFHDFTREFPIDFWTSIRFFQPDFSSAVKSECERRVRHGLRGR